MIRKGEEVRREEEGGREGEGEGEGGRKNVHDSSLASR